MLLLQRQVLLEVQQRLSVPPKRHESTPKLRTGGSQLEGVVQSLSQGHMSTVALDSLRPQAMTLSTAASTQAQM